MTRSHNPNRNIQITAASIPQLEGFSLQLPPIHIKPCQFHRMLQRLKGILNSDSGTTAQSTLRSTTDMPRQVADELNVATGSQINQESRLRFKLIPVVPPKKNEVVKSVAINATPVVSKSTASKLTPKRRVSTKSKFKSVIRPRALSPVIEDIQVESTTDFSKVDETISVTNPAINDQHQTDFEMIIESNLPILTEDAEELITVRSGAVDSQEGRRNTVESM